MKPFHLWLVLLAVISISGCGLVSKQFENKKDLYSLYLATPEAFSLGIQNGKRWENIHQGRKPGLISSQILDFDLYQSSSVLVTPLGLNVSTSNFRFWSSVDSKKLGTEVFSVAVFQKRFYLGTEAGIYTSSSNIAAWSPEGSKLPAIQKLVANANRLYAIGQNQIWEMNVSRNYQWQEIKWQQPISGILSFAAKDSKYVLSSREGVFISSANAYLFQPGEKEGLTEKEVTAVALGEGKQVFAGGPSGFYLSYDMGKRWIKFDAQDGLIYKKLNGIEIKNDQYYLATDAGLYYSPDAGRSWTKFTRENGLKTDIISKVRVY